MRLIILTSVLAFVLLAGCQFIANTFDYRDITVEFVDSLLKEDYERCVDLMALDHDLAGDNKNVERINAGLVKFRSNVVANFGDDLEYSFMKSQKTFSSIKEESTPPNTTLVLVEFSNEVEFGVFKVLFDDGSKKILNINALDIKKPIPEMLFFWLFRLLAICIPIFNIYVIRLIKGSYLKRKWLKYIAVIFLNVPAITYNAVAGLSFSLLSFQILFGISCSFMGYLSSTWTFGIPLGGIYWWWKLRGKNAENRQEAVAIDAMVQE